MASDVAAILEQMLVSGHAAYQDASSLACHALAQGTLIGIQSTSKRFLITLRSFRARPVAARIGALFQCIERRSPPTSEQDLLGWIVVQDGYGGGRLVMVHELSHFANRFVVWQRHRDAVEPVRGLPRRWDPATVAMVRARLLDEVAARHVAYLAETGLNPERKGQRWPAPGALFACAVKIASYPEIYADPGYVTEVMAAGGREALRDLVGGWFAGLVGFQFFRTGTQRQHIHTRWLEDEARLAAMGRRAPEVEPEGTL